jgi:EmrB/QacA subfamily drug resistance transporter
MINVTRAHVARLDDHLVSANGVANESRVDRALLTVASVIVLGSIMSSLDVTVVNVAINTLASKFHTTLTTIQWVATGYTLALATVIPLSGWLADRFGTKRLYMGAIGLFLTGSALTGLSSSTAELIAFRVLQGVGGGLIMPTGMTILTRAAGPQRIGRVMGILGVPLLLGPILGPVLGGFLVTNVSWRWIFYLNLPIGIAAIGLAQRILPRDVPQRQQHLDFAGFLLASPGLALVIFGLAETRSAGGFASALVLGPLLAGLGLLGAFCWHALHTRDPLLDLRLFANRTFATSAVTLTLVAISVFGSLLLLPLYFQAVRGETALRSGLLLVPQGVAAALSMTLAGRLSDRTGPGRIVPFGLAAVLGAVLWLTQIRAHTPYLAITVDLFVFGLGMGFVLMPTFSGAMQTMRREAVSRGTPLLNILQQTGSSIGTAVLSVILASALKSELGASGNAGIGGASHLPASVHAAVASKMASAFGQTWWWAAGFLGAAFTASLLLPRTKPALAGETKTPLVPSSRDYPGCRTECEHVRQSRAPRRSRAGVARAAERPRGRGDRARERDERQTMTPGGGT